MSELLLDVRGLDAGYITSEQAKQFGLRPEELNLDLGPLGRLS